MVSAIQPDPTDTSVSTAAPSRLAMPLPGALPAAGHVSPTSPGHGTGHDQRLRHARTAHAWQFELCLFVATLLFASLAYFARSTPYWAFDLALTRSIQSIDLPGFGTALTIVSWIGFPPQFTILCALIIVALFLTRRTRDACMLLLTTAGATTLWFTSTRLIGRARPDAELVRVSGEVGGGSFPSGHVLTIVAIFGFIVYLAYTRLTPSWRRTLTLVVFGLPVLVVGVARVYAGHHWPSDVLGGYMLGAIWLGIMVHLDRRLAQSEAPASTEPAPSDSAVLAGHGRSYSG